MLTTQLGYGGSESTFLRLSNYLARHGSVTIALFARTYGSDVYNSTHLATDLPIVVLDDREQPASSPAKKVTKWWRMRRKLTDLKGNHDVTVSFLTGPNLLNAMTCGPTIVSEKGSKLYHRGLSQKTKWIMANILDPYIYRKATFIVSVSTGLMRELRTVAGKRYEHKIVAIEGEISERELIEQADAPVDEDIKLFCSGPTAVFVSRLDRGKGIDLIIPAFAAAKKTLAGARLLIIGDGPLQSELMTLSASLNLKVTTDGSPEADVYFAGFRPHPVRHFRFCNVFLFPSLHEGLPNALIEAVASGIPVLSSDCPWGPRSILSGSEDPELPETITEPAIRAHGTLLPLPDTPQGIRCWEAELIRHLSAQPKRRTLDQRRAAIQRFDLEVTGPKWLSLIRDVMSDDVRCLKSLAN